MDEVDLVDKILKRVPGSEETFVLLMRSRVRSACVGVMGAAHGDLDDVIQEAMLHAITKVSSWNGTSTLGPWVYVVAQNFARNYVKRSPHLAKTDLMEEFQLNQIEDPKSLADDQLAEMELTSIALGFIRQLPQRQQTAVLLRVVDGLHFKEISVKMKCPYDTAKANYRHGIMKLRAYLRTQVSP